VRTSRLYPATPGPAPRPPPPPIPTPPPPPRAPAPPRPLHPAPAPPAPPAPEGGSEGHQGVLEHQAHRQESAEESGKKRRPRTNRRGTDPLFTRPLTPDRPTTSGSWPDRTSCDATRPRPPPTPSPPPICNPPPRSPPPPPPSTPGAQPPALSEDRDSGRGLRRGRVAALLLGRDGGSAPIAGLVLSEDPLWRADSASHLPLTELLSLRRGCGERVGTRWKLYCG
jgi:hypothetical protein